MDGEKENIFQLCILSQTKKEEESNDNQYFKDKHCCIAVFTGTVYNEKKGCYIVLFLLREMQYTILLG